MDVIDFEWWRCLDGYRIDRNGPSLGVVSVSKRYESYRPLEDPALFAKFAKGTPHSSDGILKFCNEFGLPGLGHPEVHRRGKPTHEAIALDDLLMRHAGMRRALYLFEKGDYSKLSKGVSGLFVQAELRSDPNGQLRLVFVPPDLLQAMWLQFAQHVCSGTHLFMCQRCNKPFVVGAGTGRRRTAMYCSNACKVAAFQARNRGGSGVEVTDLKTLADGTADGR